MRPQPIFCSGDPGRPDCRKRLAPGQRAARMTARPRALAPATPSPGRTGRIAHGAPLGTGLVLATADTITLAAFWIRSEPRGG